MFKEGSVGLGRGPSTDDATFFVSADFKCFRKGVWVWGGGPLMMMKESPFLLISNVLRRQCLARQGAYL